MSWSVVLEDEFGVDIEILNKEFDFNDEDINNDENIKVLKYLDPYGNTTFNRIMISDLIADLLILKIKLPNKQVQIDDIIKLATKCINEPHNYLKFYGD